METCCLIVVVAVIGLIIYSISSSVSEKNAEKEKKIKNYKNALANGKSNVNSQVQYAKTAIRKAVLPVCRIVSSLPTSSLPR